MRTATGSRPATIAAAAILNVALGACVVPSVAVSHHTIDPNDLVNLQFVSAGYLGCMPKDIRIADYQGLYPDDKGAWSATCRGRRFVCSSWGSTSACSPAAEPGDAAWEGAPGISPGSR